LTATLTTIAFDDSSLQRFETRQVCLDRVQLDDHERYARHF
jgi:hypothetical protein